ncbi:protein of unknown function [Kyrpidia spormannii]|uniref:Uncharacterized protein n=2 Tax=Kyrpidia spormannii TaxID=2055160 RepID=A0ACA8ZC94_9BACL|nr:protein of unknown function [Kyrpidia spormannii]CAB3395256.1 protein of unknown function [Kyrpidia spormannii]
MLYGSHNYIELVRPVYVLTEDAEALRDLVPRWRGGKGGWTQNASPFVQVFTSRPLS